MRAQGIPQSLQFSQSAAIFGPIPYNKYDVNDVIFYLNKSNKMVQASRFSWVPPVRAYRYDGEMVSRGDNHCILHIKSQVLLLLHRTIPEYGTPSFVRCRVPKSEPVPECLASCGLES